MNLNKLRCNFIDHSWKHFRILTVQEFDDSTLGPASSGLKVIDRKCMTCGELKTEVIRL